MRVPTPDQFAAFDQQLAAQHYLGAGRPVGDYLRQIVERAGQPVALLVWGDDWADLPEPPVSFIDRETGDVLDPVLVDRTSGRPWSEIRVQPVANDPHAPVTRSAGDPL